MVFESKEVKSAVNPYFFTEQEVGNYSTAEFIFFYTRILFTKHSDTTLKLLGKTISSDILAISEQHPTDFHSAPNRNRFYPYNIIRIGLGDHILTIAPLFAPDWSKSAEYRLDVYITIQLY